MKEFIIKPNEENQRLDKYLKKLLPNASTAFLYKMLRKKNILCNGKKATGKELLKAGDCLALYFSEETFLKFHADDGARKQEFEALKGLPMMGLSVIYEDDDILVLDKPAGLLSQKAAPEDISANERMLGYLIRQGAVPFGEFATFRPSVCNRLDRNTTGLLLAGKSLKGAQELSEMLRERTLKKYYYAVVLGRVDRAEHLKGYLQKDEKRNSVTVSPKKDSKDSTAMQPAASHTEHERYIETAYRPLAYTVLQAGNGKGNSPLAVTLLEVHLITGKTHQIRAHLASVGHPIIGDGKYGDPTANGIFCREFDVKFQLLHAARMEFPDGRVFEAPVPGSFEAIFSDFFS